MTGGGGTGALLHGWLHVTVHGAAGLRDDAPSARPIGSGENAKAAVRQVEKLLNPRGRSTACVVSLQDESGRVVSEVFKTKAQKGDNPVYSEGGTLEVAGTFQKVQFAIVDRGVSKLELLSATFPVAPLTNQQPFEQTLTLLHPSTGKAFPDPQPSVTVSLRYWALRDCPPLGLTVPNTNFRPRAGCDVRLYQDAHQEPHTIPEVRLASCKPYEVHSCWEDTAAAISNATELIYVAGWSVYTQVRLVRRPNASGETLGELLVRKANEGVVVCVMVWDDASSIRFDVSSLTRGNGYVGGVMGTHDEETMRYFQSTRVNCFKASRKGGGGVDFGLQAVYTHHQKSVVCDCDAGDGMRDLLAFVGGIDLTNGRYDTAEHALFDTIGPGGVHEDDFYMCIGGVTKETGPRQPWQDIHCRLRGSVALDVLLNFEERWESLPRAPVKLLYNKGNGLGNKFTKCGTEWLSEQSVSHGQEAWTCQLFRSIDGRSVNFRSPEGLRYKYGRGIDDSIHRAYVHHIRRAQRFIYVENQYFLGSSHAWEGDRMKEAAHLVPLEIALKISDKIDKGEPFTAYCVIPLHPEGEPGADSVQAILWWQYRTLQMMYSIVAKAILRNRLQTHPTDYLSLFCLGKREPLPGGGIPANTSVAPPDSDVASAPARLCESRRFMIYVHSKLLMVDDEYCLLGSANINMRSMAGTRDSELAVGSYQPAHTISSTGGGWPRGQVHGFRMSLWAEHLGTTHPAFERPNTPGCMHLVNAMAHANWAAYCSAEPRSLHGHLMAYPIKVEDDGSLAPADFGPTLPDFPTAEVMGHKSGMLPLLLTT